MKRYRVAQGRGPSLHEEETACTVANKYIAGLMGANFPTA